MSPHQGLDFGVIAFTKRNPDFVILGMNVIGASSELDFAWTRMVVKMAPSEGYITAALMDSVFGPQARRGMIEDAAVAFFGGEDHEGYKQCEKLLKKSMEVAQRRNQLAHWLWVLDDHKPGQLGLLQPSFANQLVEGLEREWPTIDALDGHYKASRGHRRKAAFERLHAHIRKIHAVRTARDRGPQFYNVSALIDWARKARRLTALVDALGKYIEECRTSRENESRRIRLDLSRDARARRTRGASRPEGGSR